MHTDESFPAESREIQVALAHIQCLYEEAARRQTHESSAIRTFWARTGGLAFNCPHGWSPCPGLQLAILGGAKTELQHIGITTEGGTEEEEKKV